jgi:hypothetical protein
MSNSSRGAPDDAYQVRSLSKVAAMCTTLVAFAAACSSSDGEVPGADEVIHVARDRYVKAKVVRIGPYQVLRDPTYSGAQSAFGPATSCRLRYRNEATARWRQLGITIHLLTYGGFPGGGTACSAPKQVFVDTVTVDTSRWRTSRGLKIGDSLDRLKELYPRAVFREGRWWLNIARAFVGTPRDYPALAASVASGRVDSFRMVIGAQGD